MLLDDYSIEVGCLNLKKSKKNAKNMKKMFDSERIDAYTSPHASRGGELRQGVNYLIIHINLVFY